MTNKITVAFITNIIAPYRIKLFNKLKLENKIKFKVFFEKESSNYRVWTVDKSAIKFNYEILKTRILSKKKKLWISFNIFPELINFKPNIVVCGGYGFTYMQAFLYCFLFRKKLVLWGELTRQSESKRNIMQKFIRKIAVKIAVATWSPSSEAKLYYESLGMKNNYVNLLTTDSLGIKKVSKEKYANLRHINFLYVGRISYTKGIDNLIKIYLSLRKKNKNISLTLVGEPDDKKFFTEMTSYDGKEGILFVPFTDNLDAFYKKAHIFIFCTRQDTFGLVISEAMAYGLPIVCSKYAGCASDLISNNGIIIEPENVTETADKISKFMYDKKILYSMGKNSLKIIKKELNDASVQKLNKMFVDIMRK